MTQAVHEIPLPSPEKPERERERRPEFEHATVGVGAASMWAGDVQRGARDFAERCGRPIVLTIELGEGSRLQVRELRTGPGEGFITLRVANGGEERELGVRLDRITGVELRAARDGETAFRVREGGVGFGL